MKAELTKFKDNPFIITKSGDLVLTYYGHKDSEYRETLQFIVDAPELEYDITIKAVLEENSIFDLEAILKVERGARNTNTYLKIDCLVLDTEVTTRVIPSLEIMEDAVKSGHGATVSPIAKDQIYYLESRGIPQEEAEKLIIDGFLKA